MFILKKIETHNRIYYTLFGFIKITMKKNVDTVESKNPYEEEFNHHLQYTYISAVAVIDIFKKYYMPKSVIDVGCGIGPWLKAWKDNGVDKIKGIDFYSPNFDKLLIPKEYIEKVDLNIFEYSDDKYDLAMSLEVAEHLKPESSENFINKLCSLSDMVLFSAAIPNQPGTDHINCREHQFWIDLFNKNGYDCFDIIRKEAIKNESIEWWYSQNILVFAKDKARDILLQLVEVKQGHYTEDDDKIKF